MTTVRLSPKDRLVLEKKYFWRWTAYKRMLVGLAVLFGGLWLWVGWVAWHDATVQEAFIIVSVLLLLLASFGWWSTPIYWRRHALPLQNDLAGGEKLRQTGMVTATGPAGEYNTYLLFQEAGALAAVPLLPDLRALRQYPDLLTLNEEMTLEFSPNARVIFAARLTVPHSAEVKAAEKHANLITLLSILLMVGLLLVGMAWWAFRP